MRRADLQPPLGKPGGSCFVIDRIIENVVSTNLEHYLVKLMESGRGLEKGTESKVYQPLWEKGPGAFMEKLLFSPHAQYRMDLRSVTVEAVVRTLGRALKVLETWKAKGDPKYDVALDDLRTENRLRWLDPATNLYVVVAPNGHHSASVVTVYYKGKEDAKPTTCHRKHAATVEEYSGYRTFVSPSRTEQRDSVLPSPPWGKSKPINGPLGLNKPDGSIERYPRTVPEAGRPHGNDGWVTSPSGTAIPKNGYEKQREQRGQADRYHTRYNKKHRRENNRDAKKWYKIHKNKSTYRRRVDKYRDNPERYQRKPFGGEDKTKDRAKEWREEQKKTAKAIVERYLNTGGGFIDRATSYEVETETPNSYHNHTPDSVVMDNPGSARVIPEGRGFVNKEAAAIQRILAQVGPKVRQSAQPVRPKLSRVDKRNRLWMWRVAGSGDAPYEVKVRLSPGKVSGETDAHVSCNCAFWQWQGPEHWAKVGGYLYGILRGTATPPEIMDPAHRNGLCKHAYAVLSNVLEAGWEVP